MAENSKISWTNHTFNAWIGCTKVSPGCKFCYAEEYANKYRIAEWGEKKSRHLTADSTWAKPFVWDKKAAKANERHRVFCSSLSDVMEDNPQVEQWRQRLFDLILRTPNLDWLLLTKRPDNYWKFFPESWLRNFPKNIWLGYSVCTQNEYDEHYAHFRDFQRFTKASVTFISFEPMLQPIILKMGAPDWNIIGGESGFLKNARPMQLSWVKSLIGQIQALQDKKHHIFFKQFGSHLAKDLKLVDKKGEFGIEKLPPSYDWLKLREIPNTKVDIEIKKQETNTLSLF